MIDDDIFRFQVPVQVSHVEDMLFGGEQMQSYGHDFFFGQLLQPVYALIQSFAADIWHGGEVLVVLVAAVQAGCDKIAVDEE